MKLKPPLARALARLNAARVDYIMIGVLALNHYAKDPASVYSTLDCDLFLPPDADNLARAFKALALDGRTLESGGEPLGKPDTLLCRRIVERRAMVTAAKPGEMPIDLVLEVKGTDFSSLRSRGKIFKVAGIRVPCADIKDILEAKRRAGRKKDVAFLKLYKAL